MVDGEKFYSELGKSYEPGIITQVVLKAFEMAKQGKKLISLTGGMYDPPSLPHGEVKKVLSDASVEDWRDMLQYGGTAGAIGLRKELSEFMAAHGITADPNGEIIITTGSQQALDLVSRVFLDPGDVIVVGAPTYLSALGAFRQFNPEFRSVAIDGDGMDIDALEAELREVESEGKWAKFVYLVPSFQNPTSTMLTMERRERIVELAEEYDFLIFEDNPYGYISFEGDMPTPIRGLDETGRVMYTSTFSKIVSPGMRIGWLVAPKPFITKMSEAKSNSSICNDGITQYIAQKLFENGDVARQIPKVTEVYRRKRDLMLETMETSFPGEAEWNNPKGGLFLWVKMPEHVNTTEILMESVENGVAYIPGSNFFDEPVHNYIRLNYSYPSEPDIVEGISTLGKLLKSKI
ncbi:MAG: PLP-dependent aminotransferase family protein [Candidatus Bathyarchaeota archaeon]|jgi:2-aminoadipate transaminase